MSTKKQQNKGSQTHYGTLGAFGDELKRLRPKKRWSTTTLETRLVFDPKQGPIKVDFAVPLAYYKCGQL
jgi:hypothetical protein